MNVIVVVGTMMNNKTTCGPLFKEAFEKYCGGDLEKIRLFAAGHVNGNSEKVYLGACQAAMFRPSPEYVDMVRTIVCEVCERYGLRWTTFDNEIWVLRNAEVVSQFREMTRRTVNSSGWHRFRGIMCGIPDNEIDEQFHERQGYGERAD